MCTLVVIQIATWNHCLAKLVDACAADSITNVPHMYMLHKLVHVASCNCSHLIQFWHITDIQQTLLPSTSLLSRLPYSSPGPNRARQLGKHTWPEGSEAFRGVEGSFSIGKFKAVPAAWRLILIASNYPSCLAFDKGRRHRRTSVPPLSTPPENGATIPWTVVIPGSPDSSPRFNKAHLALHLPQIRPEMTCRAQFLGPGGGGGWPCPAGTAFWAGWAACTCGDRSTAS